GFVGDALRRSYPFLDWIANTLFVFAGSVLATLVTSVAAGYALRRVRSPGLRRWRGASFATRVMPPSILFLAPFARVHLPAPAYSLLPRSLAYRSMPAPFGVWMLWGYFERLPLESEEAALLEDASRATAFFHVTLPMSRPVLIAAGIFTLGTIASDYMIASVFLLSPQNQTITAGLGTFDVALDELAAVAGGDLLADSRGGGSGPFPPRLCRAASARSA